MVVLVQLGHTIVITMACASCASSTWTYYSYYYGLWLLAQLGTMAITMACGCASSRHTLWTTMACGCAQLGLLL